MGKGHGQRAHDMRRGRNRRHKFLTAKLVALGLAVDVRLVAEGLREDAAFELEKKLIATHRANGIDLVNVTDGGEGTSGVKHSDEWKRAVSAKLKGRKLTDEHRAKIAASAIGNTRGLGTKKSAEAIERTAAAHRGKKRSAETCAKISAWQSANSRKRGVRLSAETIEKIRRGNIGLKRSPETVEKIRVATIAHCANRRLIAVGDK